MRKRGKIGQPRKPRMDGVDRQVCPQRGQQLRLNWVARAAQRRACRGMAAPAHAEPGGWPAEVAWHVLSAADVARAGKTTEWL